MKLKDLISQSKNSKNKQLIWNPKKKTIRGLGLTTKDILNIKLDKILKEKTK